MWSAQFKFFKDYLPQILLGLFLNTLTHLRLLLITINEVLIFRFIVIGINLQNQSDPKILLNLREIQRSRNCRLILEAYSMWARPQRQGRRMALKTRRANKARKTLKAREARNLAQFLFYSIWEEWPSRLKYYI